jgi:hypothetical protein
MQNVSQSIDTPVGGDNLRQPVLYELKSLASEQLLSCALFTQ